MAHEAFPDRPTAGHVEAHIGHVFDALRALTQSGEGEGATQLEDSASRLAFLRDKYGPNVHEAARQAAFDLMAVLPTYGEGAET